MVSCFECGKEICSSDAHEVEHILTNELLWLCTLCFDTLIAEGRLYASECFRSGLNGYGNL